MLHAIAYDGNDPENLFVNLISSSPYLPQQYEYDGTMPTEFYNRFVKAAGCNGAKDQFGCLLDKHTAVLQKANFDVTETGKSKSSRPELSSLTLAVQRHTACGLSCLSPMGYILNIALPSS